MRRAILQVFGANDGRHKCLVRSFIFSSVSFNVGGLSARSAGLLVGRNSLELPALGSLRLTCFLVLTIDNEVNGKHQTISIGLTNCRCYVRISCHEGDCGCLAQRKGQSSHMRTLQILRFARKTSYCFTDHQVVCGKNLI